MARTADKKVKVNVGSQGARLSSQRVFGFCFLSAVLVLLGILLYLWPHMRMVELGYQHSALRTQRAQLLQQQREYEVEVASLHRLGRIEQMAVNMGLHAPKVSQVIYLRHSSEPEPSELAQ